MSISQAQVTDTLWVVVFFFFNFFFASYQFMVFGFAFVFYYPHPASIFSFPLVISPVAGASFFGALENTRPLFILSPQYRKRNFDLSVEVALL